jgi:hypothetical protein
MSLPELCIRRPVMTTLLMLSVANLILMLALGSMTGIEYWAIAVPVTITDPTGAKPPPPTALETVRLFTDGVVEHRAQKDTVPTPPDTIVGVIR